MATVAHACPPCASSAWPYHYYYYPYYYPCYHHAYYYPYPCYHYHYPCYQFRDEHCQHQVVYNGQGQG